MKIGTMTKLIAENIAPPNVSNLTIFDGDIKICEIPLGHLSLPNVGEKIYSTGIISDAHVTVSNNVNDSSTDFPRALQCLDGISDFICSCGDGVDQGNTANFQAYKNYIDSKAVYSVTGNHEMYTGGDPYKHDEETIKSLMRTYAKVPLYYTISSNPTTTLMNDGVIADGGNIYNASIKNDDVFIMVGIATDWSNFGTGGLQWLHETLDANRNKRCFLFQHIRPDNASGNGENLNWADLWMESNAQAVVFENLLKHYKNVYFFHGHSHFTFDLQTRTNNANVDKIYGRYSIHIPSVTYPRGIPVTDADIENGFSVLIRESQGYLMEVYLKHIVLRGIDFVTGEFVPIAQYCLDTTIKTVESKPASYFGI